MGNLENCCAHSLIALNKQGFTSCSWITVLHGQHYDHGEAPLIGLALTWGSTLVSRVLAPSVSVSQTPWVSVLLLQKLDREGKQGEIQLL